MRTPGYGIFGSYGFGPSGAETDVIDQMHIYQYRSTFRCYWCEKLCNKQHQNQDHMVPVWAMRMFGKHRFTEDRMIQSCRTCNREKGNMPPGLFQKLRGQHKLVRAAQRHWHHVQLVLKLRCPYDLHVQLYTLSEMNKDLNLKEGAKTSPCGRHVWLPKDGWVAERIKAAVLKTVVEQSTVSSNLTPSAPK